MKIPRRAVLDQDPVRRAEIQQWQEGAGAVRWSMFAHEDVFEVVFEKCCALLWPAESCSIVSRCLTGLLALGAVLKITGRSYK